MSRIERQQRVLELLQNLRGLEPLKELFWSELNYGRVNRPLSRRGWTDTASKALAEDPVLFANAGEDNAFHIIYSRLDSDRLLLGLQRPVVSRLLREHPFALFVFCNNDQSRWHLLNVKHDEDITKRRLFRRITIGPEERLRTASERIEMLDLEGLGPELFGPSAIAIQDRHDEAFDVTAVTKEFFSNYHGAFKDLQKDLAQQTKDKKWAHDYALQFLNRIMFLYFVQRKRWLGGDSDFLAIFWNSYKNSKRPKDTFFNDWLSVLFFEAFNNRYQAGRHSYMPDEIRDALAKAPFLNGGLFEKNDLDENKTFRLTDARFEHAFKFFEKYNFTISEDSPLDQEVAVDPEMIGYVYETLVNVSDNINERGEAGIFYTPRTEIELMCRLALVDRLVNELGEKHKHLLYEAIFALEPQEKKAADEAISKHNLWPALDEAVRTIAVVDPACGSGSFLVGMLHILDDLSSRANYVLGRNETAYERRKRIIGQSLYGVDVMEWAVRVAELRLWLQLVIETELEPAELKFRPLLPNLDFKIRPGDSLVQEIGGVNLSHLHHADISTALKGRLTRLKGKKLEYYNGKHAENDKMAIELEELRVFQGILDERIHKLAQDAKKLRAYLESSGGLQMGLKGIKEDETRQLELNRISWQVDLEDVHAELERLDPAREALKTTKDVPFVWELSFVEIFEGDRKGFDVVIGNPPYVRQENIADPRISLEDRRRMAEDKFREAKKLYKEKLARSVYLAFPKFFAYKPSMAVASRKLDAKSDLYIYFYLHGLSLLNPRGSFCFITSNSWLDVGYGADLQEFLLKHCHVKLVLDNQARRSFAHADINTVIVLFSAPDDRLDWTLEKTARFIMFKVPFEHVLSSVIFEEIEETDERKGTPEYRVFPIRQEKLLEEGCEFPDEGEADGERLKKAKPVKGPLIKVARYIGNKWGGKYLRAPDIYWTILEKGKGKLVRLGDIAEVRFGIKTGANEFFYVDGQRIREWGIEKEFLKPVIKSPRECKGIFIDPKALKFKLFMCNRHKKDLKGTAALEYIKWGELQKFDVRPSCAGRARWWDLGERRLPPIISPSSVTELPRTFLNCGVFADKRLYEVYPDKLQNGVLLATNAITCSLFLELGSRTGLGEGLLDLTVYELADCPILLPQEPKVIDATLKTIGMRDFLPLREEIMQPTRRVLDDVIFDVLRLTRGEREAVYEAVVNLVEARLKKAESLKPGGHRTRMESEED